ncbi:hypothetical protein EV651_114273 [Kribbella sp. VKM Ac-2571]|uniref:hypothetical protein n=1 Tax=Kribbella sp. VKM Ac-2571 TaxID=2512222 RepID=UPI00105B4E2F|nr:hypothetical protein [Kribbella sp. VKM Ac-2571]TDO55569.1 hypothetical protein EV651_114273 [Kribbella sp. VKM Ac-2571]
MEVRAWNNGAHRRSGAGYGLKVRIADRDRLFDPHWVNIVLTIPGEGEVEVSLSASFWRTCSELRSAAIGRWLLRSGQAPWPQGAPPTIRLTHISGNRFTVEADTTR